MRTGECFILLLNLATLWFLWFFCWVPHREDVLRQKLFELRHDLFRYAFDHHIPFDSKAYGMLRSRINLMIRYAHTATFFRVTMYAVLEYWRPAMRLLPDDSEWERALQELGPDDADFLRELRLSAMLTVANHVIHGPAFPVFWLTWVPATLLSKWKKGQMVYYSANAAASMTRRVSLIDGAIAKMEEAAVAA